MPATYEPIATTTLTVAASAVTFASIPQTYTDLRLVCNFTSTQTLSHRIQFNDDIGGNYANTLLANSSAFCQINETYGARWASNAVGTISTIPSLSIIDIFGYTNTSLNKTFINQGQGSYYTSGSGASQMNVGLWRSTSAITKLALLLNNGATFLNAGSIFTLYGIKAA